MTKRRITPIWALGAAVLLISALVFGTDAFSLDSAKRYIVYGGDRWNLESSEKPNWITNKNTISFKVDLSEDFEKINAEQQAEEPAKEPAGDTTEAPADSTTEQPAEGTTEQPPAELTTPFELQANGKKITPQKAADFKGVYNVTIPVDAGEPDGDIKVSVKFLKNNDWKIPAQTRTFTIVRDTTKPVVDVTTTLKGKEYTNKPVTMSVQVTDQHFEPKQDTISVVKDGVAYQPDVEWDGNEAVVTFVNTGYYEVKIKAADAAGNVSEEQNVNFGIANQGPRVTIADTGKNGYYNGSVELLVENDFLILGATAVIERTLDGKTLPAETKNFTLKGKTATLKLSDEGAYKVSVTVKDRKNFDGINLGVNDFTIDTSEPALAIIGVGNGKIYTDSQNFMIGVTDTNADESTTVLKVTRNGQTATFTGKKAFEKMNLTLEGNYILELTATDKAGNTADKKVALTIDKSKPVLGISDNIEDGQFYNTEKDVSFTVEDLTLNISDTVLTVSKNGAVYEKAIPFTAYPDGKALAQHTFSEEGSYELKLKSTDKVGYTEVVSRKFTVDATAPAIEISPVEDGKEYSAEQNVAISVSDLHLDQYQLTVKKNGEEIKAEPLVREGQTAKAQQLFKDDGVYEINVKSSDKAGNEKEITKTFTIDKGAPEIHFSGVDNGQHYNSEKVDVTISVDDLTFRKDKTTLEVTRNGEKVDLPANWSVKDISKWLLKGELTLELQDEGVYQIKVTAEDVFGKKSSGEIGFTMDRTAPKVDVKFDEDQTTPRPENPRADGHHIQNGQVTITVDETYYETNKVSVTVSKDGQAQEPQPVFENNGAHSELTLPFTEDGDYVIKVGAEDKARNKAAVQTLSFTVDTMKPVIKITDAVSGAILKNNAYHSKNKDMSIVVDEHNFANNNVNIVVTETNTVTNETRKINIGNWKNIGETSKLNYEFKDEFQYTITVGATDKAGNMADEQTVTFTVDHTDPALAIDGVEDNQNYKSKQAVITVKDTNIDLGGTNLRVTRNGQSYNVGDLKLSSKTKAGLQFLFKEEGEYVVKLDSTDKAGRKTALEPVAFIIDSTKPVVKVEGAEHNSFNPTAKNVTVSILEKNFATNKVGLTVTKDGAPFNMGTFVTDQKQLSKLSYNFSKDGLYTIAVTTEDKAGNGPVAVNRTFTIDKTKPAIEITGVDNDAYYNVDKPVSVTIRDVNLDVNKITVTRDGARYAAGGYSVSGDTASLRHNFSKEGKYHIVVNATDKAGNSFSREMSFTIDKTKPVITPKFNGSTRVIKDGEFINEIFTPVFALDQKEDSIVSVELNGKNIGRTAPTASKEMKYNFKVLAKDKAGNETTLAVSFTLDTTKPNLTISGVVDGFFKNNISPMVKYFDKHLDASKTSVTLNGRPFENGIKLDAEQDYILKAVVTDLAKNVSSRTIVFTIDKTAPVIKFKEAISSKYFKEDLIPELLIKDLNAYDIISQTLDGEEYRLGDPITSEGKHVLFFEVKDKAGNIKKLSVEFILDKSAPKVVYEGVKSNETYYDPVSVSIRLDNPQDKIKSILVNGQLVNFVTTKDENGYAVLSTRLTEIQPYRIQVLAVDEAGNESNTEIPFEIAEKSALVKFSENKPLVAGSIFGLFALAGAGALAVVRRKKKDVAADE
ncbi:Ig-like domain-containing protein [Neobacillus kokaensis]|uniref:Ig-like domain-containing protein n=1 Tax=Neobacillus kokaensis TaxID=2759023 RepID=A0ABQ3N3M4_9BACI|nr:Ig-like domain-containing protein [Neobacillus kokaensis]GHH98734.1 hypothetical protein AM1BK_22770 [Neobacillus kokaensis]